MKCQDCDISSGEERCDKEATHKHPMADGEYLLICPQHMCSRCVPLELRETELEGKVLQ